MTLDLVRGIARYPYYSKPVTLTTTNSGMTKPDGTTPTVTASNVHFYVVMLVQQVLLQ